MGSSIDRALAGLLALWGSLALHAAGLVGLVAALDDVRGSVVLELELVEARPDEAPAAAVGSAPPADAAGPSVPTVGAGGTSGDEGGGGAPRGWRARLAAREAEHAARVAMVADRMGRLRAERGPPATTTGAVARCPSFDDAEPLDWVPARDLGRLAPMMPRGVLPLDYIERIGELARRRSGDGYELELALPAQIVPIAFDDPAGTIAALGRDDVQCAVRLSVARTLFPMRLSALPVQIVDERGVVARAVVDVELTVDATVRIVAVRSGTMPFVRATLARQERLQETLEDHASAFVALQALAELVGAE